MIEDLVPSPEVPRTALTRSLKDGEKQQANAAQVAPVAADVSISLLSACCCHIPHWLTPAAMNLSGKAIKDNITSGQRSDT